MKDRLRAARTARALTQEDVARAIGVPVRTYHGWEQGVEPRSTAHLRALAAFFEITVDELVAADELEQAAQ